MRYSATWTVGARDHILPPHPLVLDADLRYVRRVMTRNERDAHALRREASHLMNLHTRRHLT